MECLPLHHKCSVCASSHAKTLVLKGEKLSGCVFVLLLCESCIELFKQEMKQIEIKVVWSYTTIAGVA